MESMRNARVRSPAEVVIEDDEMVAAELEGLNFPVADFRGKDFARVLRVARASER